MEENIKNKIKKYWNDWITDWYTQCVINKPTIDKKIKDEWTIPTNTLGNKENAYKYFPEPYWGNIDSEVVNGIFLNINPGGGNENQVYDTENISNPTDIDGSSAIYNLKEEFSTKKDFRYSDLVSKLSEQNSYETTKWMLNKRVKWLNDLDGLNKGEENFRSKIENYLFFDLVPWHTPSKQDITDYCINHVEQIFKHVLTPIAELAQNVNNSALKEKIIVRGSIILDLLNKDAFKQYIKTDSIKTYVVLDNNEPLNKFSSFLTCFQLKSSKSTFYVFSGGSSMMLPNPFYKIIGVTQQVESKTLKELFQSTANNM